jgi:hypothetical protein
VGVRPGGARGRPPKHSVVCRPVPREKQEEREEEQREDRRRQSAEEEYLQRLGYGRGEAIASWDSEPWEE